MLRLPDGKESRLLYHAPLTKEWKVPLHADELLKTNFESDPKEDLVWKDLLEARLRFIAGNGANIAKFEYYYIHYYVYQYGHCFDGKPMMVLGRRDGFCHQNSVALWSMNRRRLDLVTGFCYRNGEWFEHSWCVPKHENRVIETSQRMQIYFGFRLTTELASSQVAMLGAFAGHRTGTKTIHRVTNTGKKLKITFPTYE
jgi:hypothetical protein